MSRDHRARSVTRSQESVPLSVEERNERSERLAKAVIRKGVDLPEEADAFDLALAVLDLLHQASRPLQKLGSLSVDDLYTMKRQLEAKRKSRIWFDPDVPLLNSLCAAEKALQEVMGNLAIEGRERPE